MKPSFRPHRSLGSFTIVIFSPPQTTLKSSHLGPRIQHPATSSPGGCGPSSSPPTSRNFYRWWTLTGLAFARLKIALWRNSLHFAETKTGFNIRAVIYLAKRHLQCSVGVWHWLSIDQPVALMPLMSKPMDLDQNFSFFQTSHSCLVD